jgi:hypothetical protein
MISFVAKRLLADAGDDIVDTMKQSTPFSTISLDLVGASSKDLERKKSSLYAKHLGYSSPPVVLASEVLLQLPPSLVYKLSRAG